MNKTQLFEVIFYLIIFVCSDISNNKDMLKGLKGLDEQVKGLPVLNKQSIPAC